MQYSRICHQKGFTLQEILVVLTIFTVGILYALQIFPTGIKSLKRVQLKDEAVQLANIISQRLENHPHEILFSDPGQSDIPAKVEERISLSKCRIIENENVDRSRMISVDTFFPISEIDSITIKYTPNIDANLEQRKVSLEKINLEYSFDQQQKYTYKTLGNNILQVFINPFLFSNGRNPSMDIIYKPISNNIFYEYIYQNSNSTENSISNASKYHFIFGSIHPNEQNHNILSLKTGSLIDKNKYIIHPAMGTIQFKNSNDIPNSLLLLFKKKHQFKASVIISSQQNSRIEISWNQLENRQDSNHVFVLPAIQGHAIKT